jgi:hypothetical protein
MPMLFTQFTVADYAKWRPIFDKQKDLRDKSGMRNVEVYRHSDNPNEVIVMGEADDPAKVREVLGSPEMKENMQRAGVVSVPKSHWTS